MRGIPSPLCIGIFKDRITPAMRGILQAQDWNISLAGITPAMRGILQLDPRQLLNHGITPAMRGILISGSLGLTGGSILPVSGSERCDEPRFPASRILHT